jgi:hypothetical protein
MQKTRYGQKNSKNQIISNTFISVISIYYYSKNVISKIQMFSKFM